MSVIRRTLLVGLMMAATAIGLFGATGARAQEATPAASTPCAQTSPAENLATVLDFLDAAQKIDDDIASPTADENEMENDLSEDVVTTGYTELPGNVDDVAFYVADASLFTDFSFTINDTVATGDSVVVDFTFTVNEQHIPGATPGATASTEAVVIAHFDCGKIIHLDQVVDTVTLLQQLGFIPMVMSATPTS